MSESERRLRIVFFRVVILALLTFGTNAQGLIAEVGASGSASAVAVGDGPRPIKDVLEVLNLQDHFSSKIQPILNSKCVACHSCYNSPCQLTLSSYEGLMRGASPDNLYDFPDFRSKDPTRLFIDAHSTDRWRKKGFFSVVAGGEKSVLYRLISELPGIESGMQSKYESEYSRVCMQDFSEDSIKKYREQNPAGRMPFGFPGLKADEIEAFGDWYLKGYSGPKTNDMEQAVSRHSDFRGKIKEWESFFNANGLKQKITSRYLYEHLFLAHLFFESQPNVFFRLVRSKTKTGVIKELGTLFPFEKPKQKFYYRLRPVLNTLSHKINIPFELSHQKMMRWRVNFLQSKWPEKLKKMPDYGLEGSNPFQTFSMIPASAKYDLFLQNSAYFIMTFIKGPVCRGQTALNVINDHFWVLFMDPQKDVMVQNRKIYRKIAKGLKFPALIGDDFSPLVDFRKSYWETVHTKFNALKELGPLNLKSLWRGEGQNDNAAITVFRHYDSATVLKGLRSHEPKTVWVLDYHVFESIYYNLSAGYNVFGPLLHQLNSRLFMEVSRVAAEDLFVSFLPQERRLMTRAQWNLPAPSEKESLVKQFVDVISEDITDKLSDAYSFAGLGVKSKIPYRSLSPKSELLSLVKRDLLTASQYSPEDRESQFEGLIKQLEDLPPIVIARLPESSVVLFEGREEVWTLIHNRGHYNIGMILFENERRKPEDDTLSVIAGVATSYPNMIFKVGSGEEELFVNQVKDLGTQMDVVRLYRKFAVSRRHKTFWDTYNHLKRVTLNPLTGERGGLDLNRYIMW